MDTSDYIIKLINLNIITLPPVNWEVKRNQLNELTTSHVFSRIRGKGKARGGELPHTQ